MRKKKSHEELGEKTILKLNFLSGVEGLERGSICREFRAARRHGATRPEGERRL